MSPQTCLSTKQSNLLIAGLAHAQIPVLSGARLTNGGLGPSSAHSGGDRWPKYNHRPTRNKNTENNIPKPLNSVIGISIQYASDTLSE